LKRCRLVNREHPAQRGLALFAAVAAGPAAEVEDKAGAAGVARITRRPKVADDEERRAHDGETRHRPCPPADRGLLFQLAEVAFRHLRCS
jgi:hypothetical protein